MRRIPVLDLVLGGAGLAMTGIELTLVSEYGSWPYVVETLVSLGLTVALVLRRRYVLGSAVATFLLLGAMAANVWSSPVGIGVSPLLACAPLSVVALTRYGAVRWWGVVGAVVAVLGSPLSPAVKLVSLYPQRPSDLLTSLLPTIVAHVFVVIAAYLWALRQREIAERHRRELDELARQNEVLRAENEAREAIAAARERNRIAREVHDIVAHSVALIQVEAATGMAISASEPDYARRSLETIRDASRESLTEIRYLVSVLREGGPEPGDGAAGRGPAWTLSELPSLLDRLRATGVDLHVELPDEAGMRALEAKLDAAGQLAVFRIVQESVTNAVRHGGPGPTVRVELGGDDDRCRVRVHNTCSRGPAASDADHAASGPGSGRGFGLLGLRERVGTVNGRIDYGPTGDGFAVDAEVPTRARVSP